MEQFILHYIILFIKGYENMKILVINAGSSSLKYQLFDMDNESIIAKGTCERIGIDGHLKHTPQTANPYSTRTFLCPPTLRPLPPFWTSWSAPSTV